MVGVKVFTSSKARDRDVLGERVTEWLRDHPNLRIIDRFVTQSSDEEYHCLTITLFFDLLPASG